jgi:hypothetical protein
MEEVGAISPGVKRQPYTADYSQPSGAEVKNMWNFTFTYPCVFTARCFNTGTKLRSVSNPYNILAEMHRKREIWEDILKLLLKLRIL